MPGNTARAGISSFCERCLTARSFLLVTEQSADEVLLSRDSLITQNLSVY
jgi:hypothetical protein